MVIQVLVLLNCRL